MRPGSVKAWRNAVMAAFALGGVAISTWGPRLPELRADVRLDAAGIGLVLAGATVGAVTGLGAATPLLSRLGARRGIRAMLWVIGLSIGLIGVGGGLGHSVEVTAAGFVLVGFGIGTVDVMINVEGAAVERAADKTLMPLLHAAWSAGAVVGAGIGALCAGLGVDLQWHPAAEVRRDRGHQAVAGPAHPGMAAWVGRRPFVADRAGDAGCGAG